MTEFTSNAGRSSLSEFSGYLAGRQAAITEQWLLMVRRDTQIETADRIPTPELVDHLPRLLQELCEFLRTRDVDTLTGHARRDASQHGMLRWRDGYRIDELVRELEALRQLVAASVFHYRDINAAFAGPLEVSASGLVHQFFAEITVESVRQFMQEQQKVTRACVQDLADVQQQLGRARSDLNQSRDVQQRTATIVAHELRHLLPPSSSNASPRLAMFVERLSKLAELGAEQEIPDKEAFDPRALFSEIVAKYKPRAEAKGLQLLTDCLTAPATVMGHRTGVKALAQILLEDAIEDAQSGRVSFVFDFSDGERWAMTVSDTDSGRLSGGEQTAVDSLPDGGLSATLLKELAGSLGGSLQTTVQTGVGRRLEVSLPKT